MAQMPPPDIEGGTSGDFNSWRVEQNGKVER